MIDTLSLRARQAWGLFLNNCKNIGHAQREIINGNIDDHVMACFASSVATVNRVQDDLKGHNPLTILEIGSSTGLNCFALQAAYPDASVFGIDPEREAVDTASAMVCETSGPRPQFSIGVGEKLPFQDHSIDLIICHTVIEHVQDVDQVILEISRVLSPRGIVHLDAPNYLWPFEPHLQIWTLPILGKFFVKMSAILQGKKDKISFLDHLKFVTTFQLVGLFKKHHLKRENRVEQKFYDPSVTM